MDYTFRQMNEGQARQVAAWRYEPPYDFYDVASAPEHTQNYYAALSGDGGLAGFFCFETEARVPGGNYPDDGALDVGLGLRPDLTGKGLGLGFVVAGLEFARHHFAPSDFRLTVATFNELAVKVYERAGFRRTENFTGDKGDSFLTMVRGA